MKVFDRISTEHGDVLHDVSYDFYGKRMATCSSDQTLKIWGKMEGDWRCVAHWKAHAGSIWKVAWAHPEFGEIVASCSFDRTVCIWEEDGSPATQAGDGGITRSWMLRASLLDSRDSVQDIKFAPSHLGLRLATCSADGFVRMYEALDVMNLAHWSLMEEFECEKSGCNAITWNRCRFVSPMVVVGNNNGSAYIWEYSEQHRRWYLLEKLAGHTDTIHDVDWAPFMGRSYHLVATASRDQTVRIWKIELQEKPKVQAGSESLRHTAHVQEVASFDDHHAEVWRVEWNATGTLLASSGDDGCVRLWKQDSLDTFRPFGVVRGDSLESSLSPNVVFPAADDNANRKSESAEL